MGDSSAFSTLYVGALLTIPGLLAWMTGQVLLFPSLGPTAFLLATVQNGEVTSSRRVIGGHLIGVLAGLIAYHTIAPGLEVTASTSMLASTQFRLVVSGVLAVTLTSGGMLTTETVHPPACATTLIVSLGLLSSLVDGALIVFAVVVLVGVHELVTAERSIGDAVPNGR